MRTRLMNNLSSTDALWRNDSAERRHSDHAGRISWSPRSRFPPAQARGRPKVRLECLATKEVSRRADTSTPHSRLNDRGQSPLSGAVYKNEEAVRLNFRKNARPLFPPLLTCLSPLPGHRGPPRRRSESVYRIAERLGLGQDVWPEEMGGTIRADSQTRRRPAAELDAVGVA